MPLSQMKLPTQGGAAQNRIRSVDCKALVGENMKSHPGISGRMFSAMGRNGINVRAIAQALPRRIFLQLSPPGCTGRPSTYFTRNFSRPVAKLVNLYIVGTGNVEPNCWSNCISRDSSAGTAQTPGLRSGLSNSRKMLVQEEGIDLGNWKQALDGAGPANLQQFVEEIGPQSPQLGFVDITASDKVAAVWRPVAAKVHQSSPCNKIAASSVFKATTASSKTSPVNSIVVFVRNQCGCRFAGDRHVE